MIGVYFRARVPRSIGLLSASAAVPAATYPILEDQPAFRRLVSKTNAEPLGGLLMLASLPSAGFFAGHSLRCGGTLVGYSCTYLLRRYYGKLK